MAVRDGGLAIGILGPTGVGKTAVAVELARALGTRIISCDSMQVYAGFPTLTNQPDEPSEERGLHDLVGFVDPGSCFSAVEYAQAARPLVERDVESRGRALLVGGSGLYMRAALAPLASPAAADQERRRWLEGRVQSEGPAALHAELAELDPLAAGSIDSRNVRRVVRALEAVLAGGRSWSGREDLWRPAYYRPTLIAGLSMDRALLSERIQARTARMMEQGAVEEVARFRRERSEENTQPRRSGIRSAIGYAEICRYLDGAQSLAQTVEEIAAATRGYARRQLTWLRKVEDAVMIDVQGRDAGNIAQEILSLVGGAGRAKEPYDL